MLLSFPFLCRKSQGSGRLQPTWSLHPPGMLPLGPEPKLEFDELLWVLLPLSPLGCPPPRVKLPKRLPRSDDPPLLEPLRFDPPEDEGLWVGLGGLAEEVGKAPGGEVCAPEGLLDDGPRGGLGPGAWWLGCGTSWYLIGNEV